MWLLCPLDGFANVGVLHGSGAQLTPGKTNQVQLTAEEVSIAVNIPDNSGKYGLPFIPNAHVNAAFHLFNVTNHKVQLPLGFPLSLGSTPQERLYFNVHSDGAPRVVKMKKQMLTWNESFAAHATKDIQVVYQLPLSVVVMDIGDHSVGCSYFFNYITKTGSTWKGPIKQAVFTVDLSSFVAQLRGYIPETSEQLVYLQYMPDDKGTWRFTNNILTITYHGKLPLKGISFAIIITRPLPMLYKAIDDSTKNDLQLLARLLKHYQALYNGHTNREFNEWYYQTHNEQSKQQNFAIHFLTAETQKGIAQIIDYLKKPTNATSAHLKKLSKENKLDRSALKG